MNYVARSTPVGKYVTALNNAVEAGLEPRSGRAITIHTKQGIAAVLDEEDWWATQMSWHTHKSGGNLYLCHAFDSSMHVNLHSLLMPQMPKRAGVSIDVHHVDGDSLNNRRHNLRYSTHADNVTAGFAKKRHYGE